MNNIIKNKKINNNTNNLMPLLLNKNNINIIIAKDNHNYLDINNFMKISYELNSTIINPLINPLIIYKLIQLSNTSKKIIINSIYSNIHDNIKNNCSIIFGVGEGGLMEQYYLQNHNISPYDEYDYVSTYLNYSIYDCIQHLVYLKRKNYLHKLIYLNLLDNYHLYFMSLLFGNKCNKIKFISSMYIDFNRNIYITLLNMLTLKGYIEVQGSYLYNSTIKHGDYKNVTDSILLNAILTVCIKKQSTYNIKNNSLFLSTFTYNLNSIILKMYIDIPISIFNINLFKIYIKCILCLNIFLNVYKTQLHNFIDETIINMLNIIYTTNILFINDNNISISLYENDPTYIDNNNINNDVLLFINMFKSHIIISYYNIFSLINNVILLININLIKQHHNIKVSLVNDFVKFNSTQNINILGSINIIEQKINTLTRIELRDIDVINLMDIITRHINNIIFVNNIYKITKI